MDIALSLLRLVACYLLSAKKRNAWLLILSTALVKIFILFQIGLPILATSKIITVCLSGFAWIRWHDSESDQVSKERLVMRYGAYIIVFTLGLLTMLSLSGDNRINREILVVFCNLSGYALATYRRKQCWPVWIFYDLLLIDTFLKMGMLLSASVTMLYMPIAFYGIYRWDKPKLHLVDTPIRTD